MKVTNNGTELLHSHHVCESITVITKSMDKIHCEKLILPQMVNSQHCKDPEGSLPYKNLSIIPLISQSSIW